MARGKRKRLDWVQNDEAYSPTAITLNAGQANAFALPLLYTATSLFGGRGFTGQGAAFHDATPHSVMPELNQRTIIRRVVGQFCVRASQWVIGSRMFGGFRLTVQDMDQESNAASVVAGYTMWGPSAGDQAFIFANERFLWEKRWDKRFTDASATPNLVFSVDWQGRRAIEPNQAPFAFFEAPGASVNQVVDWCFLRTLCEVP